MSHKVTWDDAALAEFEGDHKTFSGEKLEAIRAAWNTEFLDRTQ
jgi:Fe-S-cluster formation regulator IscX/YfhJ